MAHVAWQWHENFTDLLASTMQTPNLLRRQMIESLAAQQPDKAVEAAACLWGPLATQIISIVGEGGFDSLYARSVFLTQSTYPWLGANSGSPQSDHRFASLKKNLEAQSPALAFEANSLLLITFTDILASLVGESLTERILDSAWDHDARTSVAQGKQK